MPASPALQAFLWGLLHFLCIQTFALNKINVVFTYWQSQGEELFLPPAWLLKIKAENSNLKRQLKEARKFFCITQQLFLSLSQFPSTQPLSFPGFVQWEGKPPFKFPCNGRDCSNNPWPSKAKQTGGKALDFKEFAQNKLREHVRWRVLQSTGGSTALPEPRLLPWEKTQISLPGLSSN